MRIGLDADIDRIARPHGKKLRLLEIRRDPDLARHEHHQRLADGRVIAFGRGEPRDAAGDRRGNQCARQIGVGLLQRGARLLQLRLRHFTLRREDRKLLFGGARVGLRGRVVGLRLQAIGSVLLRLFDGAGAFLDQRRVAMLLLLREGERRLRLRRLFFGLIDAGLLGGDLCVDIGHVGLGLIDLRGRLIDLRPKIAVIEPHQDGAGVDELIVRHRHIDDGGADLRADRNRAGIDEGSSVDS